MSFDDAAAALKEEYRHGSRVLRMLCRSVEAVGDEEGGIFRLEVVGFNAMHWGWEGASAWRPRWLADGESGDGGVDSLDTLWKGEVLEVDDDKGLVFVDTGGAGATPCTGYFLVKPFDFLEQLYRLYHDDAFGPLRDRLTANLERARLPPPAAPLDGTVSGDGNDVGGLACLARFPWTVLWGPPGTGKTFHVGCQVAESLVAGGERVLVLSTTNRATDEAAVSIGRAIRRLDPDAGMSGRIVRVGSGADFRRYHEVGLEDLLVGGETALRRQLSALLHERDLAVDAEERARINQRINHLRRMIRENTRRIFMDGDTRAVVATVYNAARHLTDEVLSVSLVGGGTPFDAVYVDEAGLISRTGIAALALWAGRRFQQAGDPRQLAPITTMARVLPSRQAIWLAESGLAFLDTGSIERPDVHMLTRQHRMAPSIRQVVSRYQYGGLLEDADTVTDRVFAVDEPLADQPAAIWYVLDEDPGELPHIRADRGPGNRSWVRRRSMDLLDKLFRAHRQMAASNGLVTIQGSFP